jgi:hypothetical protein
VRGTKIRFEVAKFWEIYAGWVAHRLLGITSVLTSLMGCVVEVGENDEVFGEAQV